MNGYWKKLGRLFDPASAIRHPKLVSHAANPLPIFINNNIFRIFYSGRDAENRSSVGAVDIDIVNAEIVHDIYEPVFLHGEKTTFFSEGVSIGCTANFGAQTLMYFMGWKNNGEQHWHGQIGALEVHDDLRLSLAFPYPIIPLSPNDAISLSYPWILPKQNGTFQMWYGSTVSWDAGNGEMLHILKSASSVNGRKWENFESSIPYSIGQAQAFSRPTVLAHNDGTLDMWFSYRKGDGTTYRIGRARCNEDHLWELDLKNAGIDVSESGWDSEMIEYPYVFIHDDHIYMLYNGNRYGRTGFGLAVWVE
jgi:hypothetical protein